MANSITPQDLKESLASYKIPVVIDVRRKADFDAAPKRIAHAEWRDPETVDVWAEEIPRNRSVVVYCVKGGSVSQSIAGRLEQGHPDVRFLQGGIKAWIELGEPVED